MLCWNPELLLPASWRLLQPVQRSMEVTHHVFFTFHHKSFWLAHVDVLIELPIQEDGMDVHLVDVNLSLSSCSEQGSDTTESGYRSKRLVVVNSLGLCVYLRHQLTLIPRSFTFTVYTTSYALSPHCPPPTLLLSHPARCPCGSRYLQGPPRRSRWPPWLYIEAFGRKLAYGLSWAGLLFDGSVQLIGCVAWVVLGSHG